MIPLGVLASAYVAPAGGGPLSIDYVASYSTSATSISVNVGTAHANRIVVIASSMVSSTAGRYVASLSLNGTPMTEDARTQEAGGSGGSTTIYRLALPAGTTATLAIAYAGTASTTHHSVYTIDAPVTVAASETSTRGDVVSLPLTGSSAGDAIIAVANQPNSTPLPSFSDGTTVEDYNAGFHLMGSTVATTDDQPVTVTYGATTTRNMAAAAAYSPA